MERMVGILDQCQCCRVCEPFDDRDQKLQVCQRIAGALQEEHRDLRAVQRCRLAVTESALQHLMVEVRRLIARGISEPANV